MIDLETINSTWKKRIEKLNLKHNFLKFSFSLQASFLHTGYSRGLDLNQQKSYFFLMKGNAGSSNQLLRWISEHAHFKY